MTQIAQYLFIVAEKSLTGYFNIKIDPTCLPVWKGFHNIVAQLTVTIYLKQCLPSHELHWQHAVSKARNNSQKYFDYSSSKAFVYATSSKIIFERCYQGIDTCHCLFTRYIFRN